MFLRSESSPRTPISITEIKVIEDFIAWLRGKRGNYVLTEWRIDTQRLKEIYISDGELAKEYVEYRNITNLQEKG